MKKLQDVTYQNVDITDGFWKNRQKINAEVTAYAVYDRFSDSHRFEALNCSWKEGMNYYPHIYWDSDVAKWIEGAAYILAKEQNDRLAAMCDHAISMIEKNQDSDGYFNSHYLVMDRDERFKHRNNHELYCAGHLMEAACAYYEATGKDTLLKVMCRYADYIYDTFYVYQTASFTTGGHPEIELALVRLAQTTENDKYLKLSRYFLDKRGANAKDVPLNALFNEYYAQDHLPLTKQRTAEGHCVRALYLYSAMADIAGLQDDEEYLTACRAIYDNTVNRKMYITGGIGSTSIGEAFTTDYFLPGSGSYTETCAAISLAMFCRRMQLVDCDSKYADTIERIIYNGFLSGVSLDGRGFFYENPLEIDPCFYDVNTSTTQKRHMPIMQRVELFDCSCCPPNVLRFIASIGGYLYTHSADTLYVHQFMNSDSVVKHTRITQTTCYPAEGTVKISIDGSDFEHIAVRIPGWCDTFTADQPYTMDKGYAVFEPAEASVEITITFDMPVQLYESHTAVQNNAGRVAVMRGPIVYCAEGVDNGNHLRSLRLLPDQPFEVSYSDEYLVPTLKTTGTRRIEQNSLYPRYTSERETVSITLIPYFAFANRGVSEMLVWIPVQ